MCEKCKKDPQIRNTRYCDDWWDDSSHGGYKGDREYKEEWSLDNEKASKSTFGYTYGHPIDDED